MNDDRKYYFLFAVVIVAIIYLSKLFYIQVIDTTYQYAAEDNVVLKITDYPYRGLIYDRNNNLLVYNKPVYDLMVIPKEVKISDTLRLCQLLRLEEETFKSKLEEARKYSMVKPSVFQKMISNEDFAALQGHLVDYPGFYVNARTLRGYNYQSSANALGYIGEVSKDDLKRDTANYYRQGDYIGISGLEQEYEKELRGRQGVKFKLVNVRGVEKGSFKDGKYDTLSTPGQNLTTTLDIDLQMYGEYLLQNHSGAIVALEPKTGEVLCLVTQPTYNPELLSGRFFGQNFNKIGQDTLDPLFNRAIMSVYPPGSTFKPVQTLVGLQERVITADEQIFCSGGLVGDHAPPGYYNVFKAIEKSSNNYFYIVFKRIINQNLSPNTFIDSRLGLEKWDEYLSRLGLGKPLGIDLPSESGGMIPTPAYYDRYYGRDRWKWSTINSISIGQGEILISPLQMANYSAIIANQGYFYTPHMVKSIGDTNAPREEYRVRHSVGIDSVHFIPVIDAMEQVVNNGTGFRARIDGIAVCGKTGTSQNPHGEDHSVFVAFAPKDNPQIAVSVYVQNAGQGARAAASIAGLIIEKYLTGEVKRTWIEEYTLKGEFIY